MSTRRHKVGVPKRKGLSERTRDVQNALGLLLWELELELAEGPPEHCEDEDERQWWLEWIEMDFSEWGNMLTPLALAREALAKKRAEMGFDSRLKALRNVTGRTPEEAALYLAKADELERRRVAP